MKKKLQKRLALSDKSANILMKAILHNALHNMSAVLPILLSFMFIKQYMKQIFENILNTNLMLVHYIAIAIVIFILMYYGAKSNYYSSFVKVYEQSADSRITLAEKLKKLPLSYFSKKDLGDLSATMLNDLATYEQIYSYSMPNAYGGMISSIIMSVCMFIYDYRLSIALFWAVPVACLIFKISKKRTKQICEDRFNKDREVIDSFQEGINLVQEIKSYNREEHYIDDMNGKYDKQKKNMKESELIPGAFLNAAESVMKLGMTTVAIYGAYLISNNPSYIFTYLVFMIASVLIYIPINRIFVGMTLMILLDSLLQRIKEINTLPIQEGSVEFTPASYDIAFEKVNFSYEEGANVLNDISFIAKQGKVTALVGPSGGGKTTAAKLAARFWDIQGGKISIGGVDISKIDPEILLKKFSIVFQEVLLFNSSVMENIRLGRMGASDEEVRKVAQIARCDEFIEKLPQGYDTLIGENGEKLSGGERQRLSIARALLKDAPIILLDESTASLDAENEREIQDGISELIKDKTVLIIAHRMRTVIDADHIVVLKEGKVVESGNSKELIENDGIFANMYKMQMQN